MRALSSVALLLLMAGASLEAGETLSRRATMRGSRGDGGKCTIEVDVDDVAEVEIAGDGGRLRTVSGQTSTWRRFECSSPLPRNPGDFRFTGIDGRGRQSLIRDPRDNGGRALVLIEDPRGGREGYTFDIEWRGIGDGFSGGGYRDRPDRYDRRGRPDGVERAISVCQDAVTERLERDGYKNVNFRNTAIDDRPRRDDWIIGVASGRRGFGSTTFDFSCSVDFSSGRVRSVNVDRR